MTNRKCRICGRPLSTYNKDDICFCHLDHPNNNESKMVVAQKTLDTLFNSKEREKIRILLGNNHQFIRELYKIGKDLFIMNK